MPNSPLPSGNTNCKRYDCEIERKDGEQTIENGKLEAIEAQIQLALEQVDFEKLDELSVGYPHQLATQAYALLQGRDGVLGRILFHKSVRDEIIRDLPTKLPRVQSSMADALLHMGYKVPIHEGLHKDVATTLTARYNSAESYYKTKALKHKESGPYFYQGQKYGARDFNLNGRLKKDDDVLVCRHLTNEISHVHATDHGMEKTKEFIQKFRGETPGPTSVSFRPMPEMESSYTDSTRNAPMILKDENFGHFLADLQSRLKEGESCSFPLSLSLDKAGGHALQLFVEKKSSQASKGAGMIRVGMYDPNVTANMRHIQRMPEDLRHLKMSDFLLAGQYNNYLKDGLLTVGGLPQAFSEQAMFRYLGDDLAEQVAAIRMALKCDGSAYIDAVTEKLKKTQPKPTSTQVLSWLNHIGFSNSLMYAAYLGNEKAIKAIDRFFKAAEFDMGHLKKLFTSSDSQGNSFLFFRMNLGALEDMKVFGKMIQELKLKPEDQRELMLARNEPGGSMQEGVGFLKVLETGEMKTLNTYVDMLSELGMNDKNFWQQVLTQRDSKDQLLFAQTLRKVSQQSMEFLAKVLRNAGMADLNGLKDVLTPILVQAFEQGEMKTIKNCRQLAETFSSNPSAWAAMLAGEYQGKPLLHHLTDHEKPGAVEKFGVVLREFSLIPEDQEKVLLSPNSQGTSFMHQLITDDKLVGFDDYCDLLRNMQRDHLLDKDAVNKLLNAKDQSGTTVLESIGKKIKQFQLAGAAFQAFFLQASMKKLEGLGSV